MKVVFVSPPTNDVDKIVGGWDCWNEEPAIRIPYQQHGIQDDANILMQVKAIMPDVIFYVGAVAGKGLPSVRTLCMLRLIAPLIHICCDGGDYPWWPVLDNYTESRCFDRQVSIDGAGKDHVDLVTLTPIDLRPYETRIQPDGRTIKCGFAGNIGSGHRRDLIKPLENAGWVVPRLRDGSSYADYVGFLFKCHMIINSAITGSTKHMHVKGRVLESAFAGCALMEMAGAPTKEWFPEQLFFIHDGDAAERIQALTIEKITNQATVFSEYALSRYHPKIIYRQILGGIVSI